MEGGEKKQSGRWKVDELKRENEEVKSRLASLQQEFSMLEDQVRVLMAERQEVEKKQQAEHEAQELAYVSKLQQYQATITALDQCTTTVVEENPPIQHTKMLAERCRTLEQANKKLQSEARAQQQQYEVCLDRVATQVVQALLSQKSHQEQCVKLANQVQALRRQNAALSSLVGHGSSPQTLPCSYRHGCTPLADPPTFLSLPTSFTKNRQTEQWPPGGWVASWHVEESSRSHLSDNASSQNRFHSSLQLLSETSLQPRLSLSDHNTTSSSAQMGEDCYTPQERTSCTSAANSSTNTATTTCWYDIITSLSLTTTSQTGAIRSAQGHAAAARSQDTNNIWHQDPLLSSTGRNSSSSSSSSTDSPLQAHYHQKSGGHQANRGDSPDGSGNLEDMGTSLAPIGESSMQKFSPLSLESAVTSTSSSPEQKNCHVSQSTMDNLDFKDSKVKVLENKEILNHTSSEINANLLVNNVSKDEISNILQVKGELLKSLTETTNKQYPIDLAVFTCEDKSKGALNKNLAKVSSKSSNSERTNSNDSGTAEEGAEVTTKDEGYSTMSSDVQAEVKESVAISSVTTVQEEPLTLVPVSESGSTESTSVVADTSSRKGSSNKSENDSTDKISVKERKVSNTNTEYCDGLRVIYDEEDNNSDVFFIPIQEPENESLYRHSYHVPSNTEPRLPARWYSDSQLYKERRNAQGHKIVASLDRHVSVKDLAERTASTAEVLEEACNTRSLKRSSAQASLKRANLRKREEQPTSGSSEELWPLEDDHRKYLSPTYSHAELEDWSLDLSSEYLSGACGEGEGSESVGTSGAHHGSLPSIQEATPELEEDNNEFLWNGATYFKTDLDLDWSSKKEMTKSWQLDHAKENQIVMSPRSGCSDQPAVWSSSEQLSCCSEGVSKCSSDFENFCEQICNLPELKRVSFCSSELGGQEASKGASHDTSSAGEHEEELADEMCIDTVFTRDFYRLVKFESNRSLAASSKSLATSDGLLTIERLQDLESSGSRKEALASVLGFIAEQQKYCKEREAQDEKVGSSHSRDMLKIANAIECAGSPLASVLFRGTFPKSALRESTGDQKKASEEFSMRTLPTKSWKQSNSVKSKVGPAVPAKPRSCYLQGGQPGAATSNVLPITPAKCHPAAASSSLPAASAALPPASLPVLPATSHPHPSVPSRSSSLAPFQAMPACKEEVPLDPIPKVPISNASHPSETDSISEQQIYCTPCPEVPHHNPPVPDHNCVDSSCFPPVPHRSSSMAFCCNVLPVPEHKVSLNDPPPVPKRITSRALPKPPAVITSQASLNNANGTSKSSGHEGKRPRSFLGLGISSPKRPQSEHHELPSLSENPAGMLVELQRMAKVEEEEEEKRQRPRPGGLYEATSPGGSVGLGTGWVRVQPHVDLQDPQARANLLDGMMESSEGCSSETEDDEGMAHQYAQLRSMHRSRRKRKASHRSGGDRLVLGMGVARPSILGRKDLFVRFGEQEKAALEEFEFLCDFSTSLSDLGSQDLGASSVSADKAAPSAVTAGGRSALSHVPKADNHPLKRHQVGSHEIKGRTPKVNSSLKNSLKSEVSPKNNIARPKSERSTKSDLSVSEREDPKSDLSVNEREERCPGGSIQDGVDTRSLCSVRSAIRQLNKFNHNSGIKQPATTSAIPARSASSTTCSRVIPSKSSSSTSANRPKVWSQAKSKVSDGTPSGAPKCSVRQVNPPSRTPSPQLTSKESRVTSSRSVGQVQNSGDRLHGNLKTSSPTRIPRIQTPHMSSKKSSRAESPKALKEDTPSSKDAGESSRKSKTPCDKALPPKGFSSRAVKPSACIRANLTRRQQKEQQPQQPPQQQQQQQQQQSVRSGIRSPRLARLKKSSDPLDSFSSKSMCDSGSSEGSERCGGRLSLSDSCAENFSPIDSGDEVFEKEG
ncbi:uncharacterized protein LOC122248234 [Penaeus japonicus]|uniref:uncharacterized protein LOC122248234 n=1 Tax=Penaeus japonicus TaxID=27405 RepID=UPI001C715C8C|nr:uncharacterized protein LOC122248234 [Penaeus japonicus]